MNLEARVSKLEARTDLGAVDLHFVDPDHDRENCPTCAGLTEAERRNQITLRFLGGRDGDEEYELA